MFGEVTSWIAVALILVASSGLLISRDWRWSLGLLAVQYVAAFALISTHWPIGLASVKLVTGWMVAAALGMTRLGMVQADESDSESMWPRGQGFHLFLAGIVIALSTAAAPRIQLVIPGLELPLIMGSLLLLGMGLIHLGITSQVLRVILGLLTMLTGFEIIYAAIESSILVAAMLAVVNLGLALTGSYLMTTSLPVEEESG